MNIALYAIAGWYALGAITAIAYIGKTRKPLTPTTAAIWVPLDVAITVVLVIAAGRLS